MQTDFTIKECEKYLIALGVNYNNIEYCSLSWSAESGTELSVLPVATLFIGYFSVFIPQSSLQEIKLGIYDYTTNTISAITFDVGAGTSNVIVNYSFITATYFMASPTAVGLFTFKGFKVRIS